MAAPQQPHSRVSRLPRGTAALTCIAPMFSISWSALDAPSRTELTPSLRRHQAGAGGKAEPERGCNIPLPMPPSAPQPLTDGELGQGAAQALGNGLQLLQLRLLPPALLAQDLVLQPLVSLGGRRGLTGGVTLGSGCIGTPHREDIPKLPGSRGPCAPLGTL